MNNFFDEMLKQITDNTNFQELLFTLYATEGQKEAFFENIKNIQKTQKLETIIFNYDYFLTDINDKINAMISILIFKHKVLSSLQDDLEELKKHIK